MPPISEGIEDPLGFTRETAALLTGLGANLEQFKSRNVSLDDLKLLTDKDLLVLEAGEEFDIEAFKKLTETLRKKYEKVKPKFQDIVEMVKINQSQLHLLHLFLNYAYEQLDLNREDFFIDNDSQLKVSEAITMACNSVLYEIKDLENAIEAMQIISKPKCTSNKTKFCIVIGSGVAILALIYYFKK